METLIIEVEAREAAGKGPARRTRVKGLMPAVFYGPKAAARAIAVDAKTFNNRIAHLEGSHLIELRSSDASLNAKKVLLRDIQFDPVAGRPLHADFYEVDLTRPIQVRVPLHLEGKAAGVTLGGILQPILREVMVSCLPTQIPEFLVHDVTSLGMHESAHLDELKLPEGVSIVSRENEAFVTIVAPAAEEKKAAEGAEGAAAAGADGDKKAADAKKAGDAKKPEAKKDAKK
ncbi:50S ribosomal protein L25 [bacterium]|nr:50S ribosomal protein L25 [bacterium]